MKILFIISSLAQGGEQKAGMLLTNYLKKNHEVSVVCFEKKNNKDFDYLSTIYRIEIPRANTLIGKFIVFLRRILYLIRIKNKIKPDVSIAFSDTPTLVNILTFSKETKISSIRQSLSNKNSLSIYKFLYKFMYQYSDILVPVSREINIELKKLYNIKNHIYALNAIDINQINSFCIEEISVSLRQFFENPVIGFIGRFDVQKCNWDAVKVFLLIKNKIPNIKLIMVGGVDKSNPINYQIFDFCRSFLSSNGLKVVTYNSDNNSNNYVDDCDVIFFGHQSNPYKYISKCKLFILTSAWEGFPNALLEGMACKLPVVSTDCPTGPKEILVNDETQEEYGILLPTFKEQFSNSNLLNETHEIWSERLISLINDEKGLKHYIKQSQKRVADYSLERILNKWEDILKNV
jgi:glycosyltransferase involved in cell wall biosynthesis